MATLCSRSISLPRQEVFKNPNPTFSTVDNDRFRRALFLIDQCTEMKQLKQIHAQMIRTGLFFDPYSASKLFTAAAFSTFSSLEYARKVFDQIPEPNLYTWNTLIRAYASSSDHEQSILVFLEMVSKSPYYPDKFTYPFLIKAAAEGFRLLVGQAFQGMVIKASLGSDVFVLNSLIHFYSSCGDLDSAYKVFLMMGEKDVVSWNSMITGFSQKGYHDKALDLFSRMEAEKNVKANNVTMVGILSSCAKNSDLEFGKWVCSYIENNGINMNLTLGNAMLDMYTKCGSMEDAKRLFGKMEVKDIVTWTTMLDGYAKLEEYDEARRVFDAMPRKDIAAWNVLISAYEQNGKPKEALAVFNELQVQKNPKPDEITLVSTLSACAQLGAMDLGGWIHVYIKKQRIKLDCHLTTSLIDMYSKCGDLQKALEVFNFAEKRDVFVWSSMIGGLAMHGFGQEAIDLFLKMQQAKVNPNSVSFTNVLSACSHTRMVEEAKMFFRQMESIYDISPEHKHYACMVDVLGRAGYLDEALDFIKEMPIPPNASVWGAFLGACRIHGNMKLGELACNCLLELEPRNDAAHVLLSNIYAKMGKWEKVSELRKKMRSTGLKKQPGCSSIEVDGVIQEFRVGDSSHPLSKQIYEKLDEVMERIKSFGYRPKVSEVLQIVEEEEMKEQALKIHSEKLAISFGLITTRSSEPIRVMKNLRVCEDCHSAAKLISQIYSREIILRDRYRFHHFNKGHCSCMDYW